VYRFFECFRRAKCSVSHTFFSEWTEHVTVTWCYNPTLRLLTSLFVSDVDFQRCNPSPGNCISFHKQEPLVVFSIHTWFCNKKIMWLHSYWKKMLTYYCDFCYIDKWHNNRVICCSKNCPTKQILMSCALNASICSSYDMLFG
jgi:hypothetical protein